MEPLEATPLWVTEDRLDFRIHTHFNLVICLSSAKHLSFRLCAFLRCPADPAVPWDPLRMHSFQSEAGPNNQKPHFYCCSSSFWSETWPWTMWTALTRGSSGPPWLGSKRATQLSAPPSLKRTKRIWETRCLISLPLMSFSWVVPLVATDARMWKRRTVGSKLRLTPWISLACSDWNRNFFLPMHAALLLEKPTTAGWQDCLRRPCPIKFGLPLRLGKGWPRLQTNGLVLWYTVAFAISMCSRPTTCFGPHFFCGKKAKLPGAVMPALQLRRSETGCAIKAGWNILHGNGSMNFLVWTFNLLKGDLI